MRVYVPIRAEDLSALRSTAPLAVGTRQVLLGPGRTAWAVTPAARAERREEDPEDLEYDALQDAVFAAGQDGTAPDRRLAVMAGDVPDGAVRPAVESGGAFGVEMPEGALLHLASVHVSELGAAAIERDDTDPALLWFDAGEAPAALAYRDREE